MSNLNTSTAKARRIARVRARISGTATRPRLAVFRSISHIYVQAIDDVAQKTLASVRDTDIAEAQRKGKKKTEISMEVGKMIAERLVKQGINQAVFDRRDKRYHGRVKALAEGAREAGLTF
ncbi:MAG: 50S ribosomal protein L18 [Candidatus Magasanikbacteria bacterium]|nr:50S ribosomal protein L18 [Candidatus Magasanikbacteria bacterium]MCA9391030.1 50S ribosomal protein L18 [Candidatus Magasanikbacteria bacterium]